MIRSRIKENEIRSGNVESRRVADFVYLNPSKTTSGTLALYELSELSEYPYDSERFNGFRSYRKLGDHRGSSPLYQTLFWFDPNWVGNWLFKWPIFVYMGRDTGVCLSRVRHTIMLHDCVSPGVPYDFKSVLSTAKAHGCVASRVSQVSLDQGQGTRSNGPAPVQGTTPSNSRLATGSHDGEARQAFYQMMNDWFIDKIRKFGAEEFGATTDDDDGRVEFWIENTIQVLDELSLDPDECIKCAISLLRDTAYHWWKTLISVVPRERDTWDFFQVEFKRNILARDLSTRNDKSFLSLNKVVCLLQNTNTRLLVEILEIKEFVVLVGRAYKAKELEKEKRKADLEVREVRKRSSSKSFQSASKKVRDDYSSSKANMGHASRDRKRSHSSFRAPTTSVASVGNV
ncbi:Sal-like protein 1 [Gossypium arboreum]|uniref:Sal-like protein 1 n=1 Tax=Gossypium arboreum TaxID=29729 RepID=A0A0B0P2S3_GOSAR|nr:Sal-like protein 1 [Gossypium arboreum]